MTALLFLLNELVTEVSEYCFEYVLPVTDATSRSSEATTIISSSSDGSLKLRYVDVMFLFFLFTDCLRVSLDVLFGGNGGGPKHVAITSRWIVTL